MRRLLQLFTAMSLLSVVVGCHHMVGVCDCENSGCPDVRHCASCGASGAATAATIAPVPVQAPREMPKVSDR